LFVHGAHEQLPFRGGCRALNLTVAGLAAGRLPLSENYRAGRYHCHESVALANRNTCRPARTALRRDPADRDSTSLRPVSM
jgi:hypothetical protein